MRTLNDPVRRKENRGKTVSFQKVVAGLEKTGLIEVIISQPREVAPRSHVEQGVHISYFLEIMGMVDESDARIRYTQHFGTQNLGLVVITNDHLEVGKGLVQDRVERLLQ